MADDIMPAAAILKIGQRLAFFSDVSDEKYSSRIEDLSDKEIVAAMPMDRKRRPPDYSAVGAAFIWNGVRESMQVPFLCCFS